MTGTRTASHKTTIHVSNLPKDKAAVKTLFEGMAGFQRIAFHADWVFVSFSSTQAATNAIDYITRKTEMLAAFAKNSISAHSPPTMVVQPNPILFVSLNPATLTEQELTGVLQTYRGFESCRFFPSHALVRFHSVEYARYALENLNETTNLFANYSTKGAKPPTSSVASSTSTAVSTQQASHGSNTSKATLGSTSRISAVSASAVTLTSPYPINPQTQSSQAKRTIHVTHIDKSMADLYRIMQSLPGFQRIAFYPDYCFVIFSPPASHATQAIEEILFKTRMKASLAKADYTSHIIPSSSIGITNSILRIADFPSTATDEELIEFFKLFQGFKDVQFYQAS
eukprot:jgi/Hompol1/6980/HPOL_004438-RA